ncbi:glutathione S-transferase family protein [Candidatus Woesearchaeota archaeon]|nr:glutathione S-transferase family protein [Candidatus Woesearchaeota archaeon]
MLKIYGNRQSGNCNKVEYTAILAGVSYDYLVLDFQKDLKKQWYLKINPVGKMPAIDDDGFILFESGAICKYICDKKGSSLYPKELKQRALVDQWIDFSINHVGVSISKVAFNRIFAPMFGLPVDENSLKEGLQWLERYLPIVDTQLEKSVFLAGNELSLADITLLSVLEYSDKAKVDLSSYKSLTAWRNKLLLMDFYKTVHSA